MPATRRRTLADVDLWLATVFEAHEHHRIAMRWWTRRVEPAGTEVVFCRSTQLGLLRLLSNVSVMGAERHSPAQAWEVVDRALSQPGVSMAAEPAGVDRALRDLTRHEQPSTGLWSDAYLAAFAIAGRLRLATFDRGFRRFRSLDLELLG